MKILHTITSMDPRFGGVCQAVRSMARSLEALGVANEVVSFDSPDAPFVHDPSLRIHPLGAPRTPWAYQENFRQWMHENALRFDTIITHGLWQFQSFATAAAVRWIRRRHKRYPRLFVMPHGMLDPYFQKAEGRKLKAIRNAIYWALLERNVIQTADGILFTCEEERVLANKSYTPYRPKRELIIGLGVERPPVVDARIKQRMADQLAEQGYLLFLSRIHEKKGVDLLLKAYKKVVEAGELKQDLVVAGPGMDSPYGIDLRSITEQNEMTKQMVSFPGMLTGEDKWAALYGCSAFVLPSHQENFGIAVVEALACGKPVLISNQVNIWREIESAGCGLISNDSEDGVEQVLLRWTRLSPSERDAMGRRARQLFESKFESSQVATQMLAALSNQVVKV